MGHFIFTKSHQRKILFVCADSRQRSFEVRFFSFFYLFLFNFNFCLNMLLFSSCRIILFSEWINYDKFSQLVSQICKKKSVSRWSQDPATRGVVGKPLILIDINEPHAQTAGAHFRDLRFKYGNPIVVMNLVKKREKRRHEGVLHEQFVKVIFQVIKIIV